jgi:hypothetical protein
VAEGGCGLGGNDFVSLAEVAAPLGMPNGHVAATELDQHRAGHLSGLGSGVVGGQVLGSDADTGSGEDPADLGERRVARQSKQLQVSPASRSPLSDPFSPGKGLVVTEVRLQAHPEDNRHTVLFGWLRS